MSHQVRHRWVGILNQVNRRSRPEIGGGDEIRGRVNNGRVLVEYGFVFWVVQWVSGGIHRFIFCVDIEDRHDVAGITRCSG